MQILQLAAGQWGLLASGMPVGQLPPQRTTQSRVVRGLAGAAEQLHHHQEHQPLAVVALAGLPPLQQAPLAVPEALMCWG